MYFCSTKVDKHLVETKCRYQNIFAISDVLTFLRVDDNFFSFLQGGLVFICGSRDGLMSVTGRKHNTDDIIATVLAVEPMKFIYRGRIAVFSHRVLRDERICVIAEQRPDCSEEEVTLIKFDTSSIHFF